MADNSSSGTRGLIFISHAHEDSGMADGVAAICRIVGLRGFVAHRDIEPSADWREEIIYRAKQAVGLVAILTPRFHASYWTDQEVGMAIAREVPVISLTAGSERVSPYGFLGKYQGLRWVTRSSPLPDSADATRLVRLFSQAKLLSVDGLLHGLKEAESGAATRLVVSELVKRLNDEGRVAAEWALRIAEAIQDNYQVQQSDVAQRRLPPLLEDSWDGFPETLKHRVSQYGFAPKADRALREELRKLGAQIAPDDDIERS